MTALATGPGSTTDTRTWSERTRGEAFARLGRADAGRWLAQVAQVRACSRPVRLIGSSARVHPVTGEVLGGYTSTGEPDGVTYVRCGNRRRSVCPSCSHEYQGDAWHVLMAGAVGGMKDVPAAITDHPLIFLTLTAPSFGPVHASKKPGRPGTRRCRPRSGARQQLCTHGRPAWCMTVHDHGDELVGQPLCAECYDYTAHVVWQWWAPELWRRFTITFRRRLAQHLGLSETAARKLVRVQFAKVAEFQRRGVIHFHALLRLDGPPADGDDYPAPRVQVAESVVCDLASAAAKAVTVPARPVDGEDVARVLQFGTQVDARPITNTANRDDADGVQLHPETVAAYVAKYATKAAGDIAPAGNAHLSRLRGVVAAVEMRARLDDLTGRDGHDGRDGPYRGWGRWVDTLGFRGHFSTKSRRYSTTFGRLRQARRDHATHRDNTPRHEVPVQVVADDDMVDDESTLIVGSWRFAGMGWLTSGDAALAAASAARARDD